MPRKLSKPRPRQGAHLAALRVRAGLTQMELADAVGESQGNIAFWELSEKPPRSEVLPKLAKVLGVSVEHLLSPDASAPPPARRRHSGPVSKVERLLAEVTRLPRRQQDKVIEFVEAFVDKHKREAG